MADNQKTPAELQKKLQEAANEDDALVMSFIAPDTIVKKSPNSYDYAQITYQDLYNIEEKVEPLKEEEKLPKKLHLIIHSPGGRVDATTKIARYLRDHFDEIEVYIPYEAASGGTVICLAANLIVMGATSNLTPIDPQILYKGRRISAYSYEQAIREMRRKYSTTDPDDIPSPDQQMCNQFDPIIAKEMSKTVFDSIIVALELLEASQKTKSPKDKEKFQDKIFDIAFSLTKTEFPHDHQINAKSAEDMGLNISKDGSKLKLLKTYKEWVSCKLNVKEANHIVETYIPEQEKPNENESEKTSPEPNSEKTDGKNSE